MTTFMPPRVGPEWIAPPLDAPTGPAGVAASRPVGGDRGRPEHRWSSRAALMALLAGTAALYLWGLGR